MEFNNTKSEVLRISRSKTLIQRTYYLHATPLREVDHAKNQGIWFSKDLKWNRSIDDITAKAYCTFGFLNRNLQENLSTLKARAYKGLVRPQVEHCSSVWDSCPGIENNGSYKIERIQCCNARSCLCRYNNTSSITNILEDLGCRTLEQCRIVSQLTALFKITRGLLSVNYNGLLRPVTHRSRHLHSKSFIPLKLACPLSIYPFSQEQWNNLPTSVFREHCSLDTFKAHLRYQPPFRTVRAWIAVALVAFIKTPINHIFFKSVIIPDYGFELTKTIYLNVFRNWNALCKRTRLYKSCSTPAGNKRKKTINTAFASQHVPLKNRVSDF